MLYHFDRRGNLMDVARHTHHIYHAFALGQKVGLEITAANVRHDRDLHIGVVCSDDRANVLLVAELPLSEFALVKDLLACLVSEFHIIYTGSDVRLVKSGDELVRKFKIIAKTAVAESNVKNLDVISDGQQITFSCSHIFSPCFLRE